MSNTPNKKAPRRPTKTAPTMSPKKTPTAKGKPKTGWNSNSPIQPGRNIPVSIQALLYALAAGRCEFRGCNDSMVRHHLSHKHGTFAQMSHIWAFSRKGPRGGAAGRPQNIHSLDNLILLCPKCHIEIDHNPAAYPVDLLREYKKEHEDCVHHLTSLNTRNRTVVLQLKSRIGGEAVEIPLEDVTRAVAPRWPTDSKGEVIDVTQFDDTKPGFIALAAEHITKRVERLYDSGMAVDQVRHISCFALAPIPLLVHLGSRLSNKIPVEFYQRHRDTKSWEWKTDGVQLAFEVVPIQSGTDLSLAALLLSISGTVDRGSLPAYIDASYSIFELRPVSVTPSTDILRRADDLVAFASTYRGFLADLGRRQPTATAIHLFPAVPAPVALACGYDLLKKAHSGLVVYDFDKKNRGFTEGIRVNLI